jgi:signal peptidase I
MPAESPNPRQRRRKCSLPTVPDVSPPQLVPPKGPAPEPEQSSRGFKLPVDSQPLVPIHTPVPVESHRRRSWRRVDSKPLVPIHTPVPLSQPLVPIHTPSLVHLPPLPAQPPQSRWARRWRTGLELFVIITTIVFLLRLFLGEAFLVPTGSMAPTLLGHHKAGVCPCCGHTVQVGRWGSGLPEMEEAELKEVERQYRQACCPNCGWESLGLEKVAESVGDRLLVHKHVYQLRQPKRWELVVFRQPNLSTDASTMTYVKRLVGLPGETVQIRGGKVSINGRLARKNLQQVREMRQLVYDDGQPPQDAPKSFRWQGEYVREERSKRAYLLQPPSQEPDYIWLTYHHLVRGRGPEGETTWSAMDVTDQQGYQGERAGRCPVWDLMVCGEVEPQGASWLAIALTDGYDDCLVEIPIGGEPRPARLTFRPSSRTEAGKGDEAAKTQVLSSRKCVLPSEGTTAFEIGCVDRTLFLTVGGQPVFPGYLLPEVDPALPRQPARGRLSLSGLGPLSLGCRGGNLRMKHLKLYRDIYYTSSQAGQTFPHGVREPVRLGASAFFVLGDNSANSYDSRCWPCSPVVQAEWILGKPCLVHFPVKWTETKLLGERRTLAVPDWSRIRILR